MAAFLTVLEDAVERRGALQRTGLCARSPDLSAASLRCCDSVVRLQEIKSCRHRQQHGDAQREGRRGEVDKGKGGIKGDRRRLAVVDTQCIMQMMYYRIIHLKSIQFY